MRNHKATCPMCSYENASRILSDVDIFIYCCRCQSNTLARTIKHLKADLTATKVTTICTEKEQGSLF